MNWREQSTTSHYQTAVAIAEQLKAGNIAEATAGVEELIDALARSDKRALRSQLARLMAHIIKWRSQPEGRSRGWRASIANAREEIAAIREETPSLTEDFIRGIWDRCFQIAKRQAEGEMEQEATIASLTWDEVFHQDFGNEPTA
ncbi:MAG: DUF29 domain-containing protein [Gemmataceae bacterium]|nr:DUF29 domain-containing protein [Gemmataceae bacterium]